MIYALVGFGCLVAGFSLGKSTGYEQAIRYFTDRLAESEKIRQFAEGDDGR